MVDLDHKPDQRLRAFMKSVQNSGGDVTPLPEDIAKGINVHSQLQDGALLHRYELEVGNLVNNVDYALTHPSAYEGMLSILNELKADSEKVLKGQGRSLTFDSMVEKVNHLASHFVSLKDFTQEDADSESNASLQNSLAMFSNTNANNTQHNKGGGRSSQSRASSKGGSEKGGKEGKGGGKHDGGKGNPKKPPQQSKQEKQKHRDEHSKNSATRFYGHRTPPNKSNVGDHTHLVTDLIQNAMHLFGILLDLTSQGDNIQEHCRLDSAVLDDIFEYITLALDNAMLRSNTDKAKNSARTNLEVPLGTSNEDAKKLRTAAAKKATASVPTGTNHTATMIRIKPGQSLPGEVYLNLKTAWDKVRSHYPFLVECKLVLEFLRRDEYLFASALIPLSTIIQAKTLLQLTAATFPNNVSLHPLCWPN